MARFVMYAVCDAEGNLIKGEALQNHVNAVAARKSLTTAADPFQRTRELFAEAKRLSARKPVAAKVPEPKPEIPAEPAARWSRHDTSFRPMWRRPQED